MNILLCEEEVKDVGQSESKEVEIPAVKEWKGEKANGTAKDKI